MASDDYLTKLLVAFGQAFQPLQTALGSAQAFGALLANLGWQLDPNATLGQIQPALASVAGAIQRLSTDSTGNPDAATLASDIAGLTTAIADLSASAGAGLPAPLNKAAFWTSFPDDILSYLVYRFLRDHVAPVYGVLRFIGVLAEVPQPADATSGRLAYTELRVDWSQLPARVSKIGSLFADVYGWGGSFEAEVFIANAAALLNGLGAASSEQPPADWIASQYFAPGNPARAQVHQLVASLLAARLGDSIDSPIVKVSLAALPAPPAGSPTAAPAGFVLFPVVTGDATATLPLTANVAIVVSGEFQASFVQARIYPSGTTVTAVPVTVDVDAGVELTAQRQPAWVLAGDPQSTRLQVQKAHAGVHAQGPLATAEFRIEGGVDAGQFVIDLSDADGFIQDLLGSTPQQMNLNLAVAWSSRSGLSMQGQATLEATVPVNQNVAGVLAVDTVYVSLGATSAGVTLSFAASGGLNLGPLTVRLERVGVSITGRPAQATSPGNMGLLDFGFGFKAPDGAGLGLQAPPVTGVGFLEFDEADGRYLGAIALQVGDVSISAVGVLDTKVPGGGYSLIVVASAQFPPIQLGFGFSLSGIGGLVGVNRTANVPALQALARAGRLDDLMFPADLINRAPQVAANLEQQFPVAQGHFIVGPAVQIQWGAGGMVYADIGVFIELTDSGGGVTVLRIALLGLVHLTLPDAVTPVADITLDVLGVLDFAAQTLSLDAGLRNSTIATFPLTGQAALRAGWGANPEFLFAIGGWCPAFKAPAQFPALQRITLSIGGDDPRLTLSAYLAVTSNTLQFGCAADLYASANVSGVTAAVSASLTFDALIQIKPFGMIVDLTIAAAILVNNNPILTLNLDLHVTGPDPWTATGSASFGFLWFTITVPICITAGPAAPPQPAQTVDLDGNLLTALADPRSWATGPPPGGGLVRVGSQASAGNAVHPLGSLTVRQHAVPLGQRIERYGPDLLDAPCRYDITGTDLGAQPASGTAVTDFFAPAQFLTMGDADKLSAPSFEMMTAGTSIGGSGLTLPATPGSGQAPATVVDMVPSVTWDTLTLDSPDPAPSASSVPSAPSASPPVTATLGSVSVPDTLLAAQLGGAAAALAGPAGRPQAIYANPGKGITVQPPEYALTGLDLAAPASADAITDWHLLSVTAGLTAAAQAGYQRNWQVVYNSEVP